MKIKKIHCLMCDTIIEVDFDASNYNLEQYTKQCSCKNETSLTNYFTISQPGSIVSAIDKSIVKAQILNYNHSNKYDIDCDKDGWFYLIKPDAQSTPIYTKWLGAYGGDDISGFIEGIMVVFTTEKSMTFNQCRTVLKQEVIKGQEGRIYHLIKGIE